MNQKRIVIASPHSVQRNRLRGLVDRKQGFEVIACTGDLMNTYNEVEERLPKAVLIADVLADLPEFEVMRALFSTLDIRWLVITTKKHPARLAPASSREGAIGSDLFSIPDDAPEQVYLQHLAALTCSNRHQGVAQTPSRGRTASGATPSDRSDTCSNQAKDTQKAGLRPLQRRVLRAPGPSIQTVADKKGPSPDVKQPATAQMSSGDDSLILIGASTGGVDALLNILTGFPQDCPPTLVVQHTGTGFGESLAALLDRQCLPKVRLAADRCPLEPGLVLIGAGIKTHLALAPGTKLETRLQSGAPVAGHIPSVDVLFSSAVHLANKVTAALLTGMGRDGADGMKALHDAGAYTIAQDEASCVVYGMPRAAVELGGVSRELPLNRIGAALLAKRGTSRKSGKEFQQ